MWQNIKRHHPAFLRNDAFIFCHGFANYRRFSTPLKSPFFILYYGMTHRRYTEDCIYCCPKQSGKTTTNFLKKFIIKFVIYFLRCYITNNLVLTREILKIKDKK